MKKKHFLLVALALLTLFLVTSCEEEKPEPLPPINTYGLDERWFCDNINETIPYYDDVSAYGMLYYRKPVYEEGDLPFFYYYDNDFFDLNKGSIEYEFQFFESFGHINVIQKDRVGDPLTITRYWFDMENDEYIFDNSTGEILPSVKIVGVSAWKMTSTGYPDYVDITDTPAAAPYLGWLIYKDSTATQLSFVTDPTDLYIISRKGTSVDDTNFGRVVFPKMAGIKNFIVSGEKVSVLAAMGEYTLLEGEGHDNYSYFTPLPMD